MTATVWENDFGFYAKCPTHGTVSGSCQWVNQAQAKADQHNATCNSVGEGCLMEVLVAPKRREGYIGDTDAFCGPCFHRAMNHTPYRSTAPMCWECPGAKADFADQPFGWWDRPDGDPSLEGWSCPDPACKPKEGA